MRKFAPVDVSIIIVSYNTREMTRIALDTIAAETKLVNYEVIAVDDQNRVKLSRKAVLMTKKDEPADDDEE